MQGINNFKRFRIPLKQIVFEDKLTVNIPSTEFISYNVGTVWQHP